MPSPKYKPYLDGQGGVKIGLSPISESKWLEIDDRFIEEIHLKKGLLETNRNEVLQIVEGCEGEQNEILESILNNLGNVIGIKNSGVITENLGPDIELDISDLGSDEENE